ncbi:sigma-70 family RNA polymerase sigma factor [Spirosoma telluris]
MYKLYAKKVYQRCLTMVKNQQQAEDFTHDILLKAYTKWDQFQGQSNFFTWLYTITTNHCLDQHRINKRHNFVSLPGVEIENIPDSTEEHLLEEKYSIVDEALNQLSAQDRMLLRMKYEEGIDMKRIAQQLNISVSAVKMRLKRSRERLSQHYQRCGK